MSKANEKAVKEFFSRHGRGEVINHAAVVALLDAAERRALLSLERWAERRARHLLDGPAAAMLRYGVAAECRRRAKGKR